MADDYKLIESVDDDDDDDSEGQLSRMSDSSGDGGRKSKANKDEEDGVNNEVIDDYGRDVEEFINIKGVLNIERIKDIMGEIMSSC